MTHPCPAELTDAIARIGLASSGEVALPDDLTGELRVLARWWGRVSSGQPPQVRFIESGDDYADVPSASVAGVLAAQAAVDSGANLIVPRISTRDDLTARTVVAVLARTEPQDLVPQPPGIGDGRWMQQVVVIRDQAYEAAADGINGWDVLAHLDARGIAFGVGVLLAAAARRTPSLIDGVDESAAAVVADRLSGQAHSWWLDGSQSTDPARSAVAERVPFAPGLPLRLADNAGRGAQATVALLGLVTSG